jgi:membrane-bound lytic murein transglycosylase D
MKRSWPVFAFAVLCVFISPAVVVCQPEPVAVMAAAGAVHASDLHDEAASALPNDPDIPANQREMMRSSQVHYLEGSNLLKSGESAKAREEFNKAVDIMLKSGWDLTSTPVLDKFFQDLIYRIQQDESRYLLQPGEAEEKAESAVVDELDSLDLFPITIDPALKDIVESDLANARFDIPVVFNDRVLQSLNFWLSRGRKYFTDGLIRSGRYREMIQGIFREASIPSDLMYLAQVESLFKTNALSRAQAKGIWQFGKWTAIRYGLKVNRYIDERSDPEKSTRAAASYLNDLYAMFKDWNLVLAAYNWGEAKVQRLIDKSGVNDFWNLADLRRRNFPQETKNHVPLIMASIILARHPEKYGLPTELDSPESFERAAVTKPIDLKAAAKVLGTSVEELKALNPALRGSTTPPDYPDFELKVPMGSNPSAPALLARLPVGKFRPSQPESASRHKIKPGDTLGKIAAQYRVSVAALQAANSLQSEKALRVGAWINIPSSRRSGAVRKAPPKRGNINTKVASAPIRSSIKPASNAKTAQRSPSRARAIASNATLLNSKAFRRPASAVGRVEMALRTPSSKAGSSYSKRNSLKPPNPK